MFMEFRNKPLQVDSFSSFFLNLSQESHLFGSKI